MNVSNRLPRRYLRTITGGAILATFLAVLSALNCSTARAEVLVYEGFHPEDYNNVTAVAAQNLCANNVSLTGTHTTGFDAKTRWTGAGTQICAYGANLGLDIPAIMCSAGFSAIGGAAGCNPGSNATEHRSAYHALANGNAFATSGTSLFVRMLVNVDSSAAEKLAKKDALSNASGGYYGCGFCSGASNSEYYPISHVKSAFGFAVWKNTSEQLVLSFVHTSSDGTTPTSYPLVVGVSAGATYLCYAEIRVGASESGEEIVRAGAVKTDDFAGAVSWSALAEASESVTVDLITDTVYPKYMSIAGPYGTKPGYFRVDEIVVGTSLSDILPVGGAFSVAASGVQTVGTDSFETEWLLVADEGVTADAGLVWSTDETFATATTNSLGTGLSADTRTATLSGLEPDTTYWWKIVAEGNGAEEAESAVASFTTKGAPVLGTATATVDGETASFSVALATAAMENTLTTSVSVFYGTDGETWTELPLGSASEAQTFSGTVQSLGYGVTRQWYAQATATLAGGRVLSAQTDVASFTTLYNGDMYVDAAAQNATAPYSTPATAAPDIATALALATDGATIHVAPGTYKVSSPVNVAAAVAVIGDSPSAVVVTNTVSAGYTDGNHRVFELRNAGAVVAGLTIAGGSGWGTSGCGFWISTDGGTVSNCVVSGGRTKGNQANAAGGYLEGGCVTHTVFRDNLMDIDSDKNFSYRPGVLWMKNASKAENCLFVENSQNKAVTLVNIAGSSAVMRNCTIVDTSLSATNDYCKSWSALHISASGATVQNVVIAGVTNTIDGAACPPTGSVGKFLNGAFDGDATELPEGTIVGTASSFFKDYANGNYTPKTRGSLVNKGANYEGMASVDLAGNPRKVGSKIDIGCYEARSSSLVLIIR